MVTRGRLSATSSRNADPNNDNDHANESENAQTSAPHEERGPENDAEAEAEEAGQDETVKAPHSSARLGGHPTSHKPKPTILSEKKGGRGKEKADEEKKYKRVPRPRTKQATSSSMATKLAAQGQDNILVEQKTANMTHSTLGVSNSSYSYCDMDAWKVITNLRSTLVPEERRSIQTPLATLTYLTNS